MRAPPSSRPAVISPRPHVTGSRAGHEVATVRSPGGVGVGAWAGAVARNHELHLFPVRGLDEGEEPETYPWAAEPAFPPPFAT